MKEVVLQKSAKGWFLIIANNCLAVTSSELYNLLTLLEKNQTVIMQEMLDLSKTPSLENAKEGE